VGALLEELMQQEGHDRGSLASWALAGERRAVERRTVRVSGRIDASSGRPQQLVRMEAAGSVLEAAARPAREIGEARH